MEAKYKSDPNLVVKPKFYNNGVPVFEPTMDEFEDFYRFNKAINHYGMQSGIVKIIPPLEWINLLNGMYTKDNLDKIRIKNPIVQNMNVTDGRKGVFSSQNVEKQRKFNIHQWKKLSQKPNNTPPPLRQNKAGPDKMKMELRTKGGTPHSAAAAKILLGDFNIEVSEFTPERCEELQNLYWKSLGYSEPMYGADMLGSVFDSKVKSWNVAHLPNLLDLMDETLPGVNDAYLYAGLWKASFSWHLEDQDLYSINYLHFGAPKQWYSIPQADSSKFFSLMKDIFEEHYKNCHEFLRHKTFIASPEFLKKNGIRCNSVVHNQGEFVITYPYGYHAGFNYGFNLAESVNFALDDWLEIAKNTHKCECIKDSVGINYRQIYCKFKGIPYTSTLISESLSVETKAEDIEPNIQHKIPIEAPRPGRKRQKFAKKLIRQCQLCPNILPDALTKYHDFQLVSLDNNIEQKVHRICALSQHPPIKFDFVNGIEYAFGVEKVHKSLRSTKCTFCHVPNSNIPADVLQGAGIACSMPKCRRHYHATCALSSGYTFDEGLCKMHRAKRSRFLDPSEPLLDEKCLKLLPHSVIQFASRGPGKRHVGDIFCGIVIENNSDEHSLSVLIYPAMTDQLEIHYQDILMTDSAHLDNSRFISMSILDMKPLLPLTSSETPPMLVNNCVSEDLFFSAQPSLPSESLPMMSQFSGPQYGCSPVIVTPSTSFSFEMERCRSGAESNNLVFVNEYSDLPVQNLFSPENFHFVEANYRTRN